MKKVGITFMGAWAFGVLLLGMQTARAANVSAPPFNLFALDGQRFSEQYLLGQPTLVVFWASWCPVCQVELPKLHALFEDTKARGLQVLTIGFADDEEKIRDYVRTHPGSFDYPVLYDPRDRVAKRFGVLGTPMVYLINPHGEIKYVTWLIEDPALIDRLKELLDAPQLKERGS